MVMMMLLMTPAVALTKSELVYSIDRLTGTLISAALLSRRGSMSMYLTKCCPSWWWSRSMMSLLCRCWSCWLTGWIARFDCISERVCGRCSEWERCCPWLGRGGTLCCSDWLLL